MVIFTDYPLRPIFNMNHRTLVETVELEKTDASISKSPKHRQQGQKLSQGVPIKSFFPFAGFQLLLVMAQIVEGKRYCTRN